MTSTTDWQSPYRQPEILRPDAKLAQIMMVCLDVDGVMTDGGFYYDSNGVAMVRFHVLDGLGLKKLAAVGVEICIVSQSNNAIIPARAKALGISNCFVGIDDKLETVSSFAKRSGIPMSKVAHIADDENDLTLLRAVGVPVTVPNGVKMVKEVAQYVTATPGGHGAVRELCEAILASRQSTKVPEL